MKYVLDSCVAFKFLVPEVDTDKARRLMVDYVAANHELLAPDILPIEVTHALTRAERQGRVTPAQGSVLLKGFLKLLPSLHAYLPLLPRAYEISSNLRHGVYDCLYVALAEHENCELITSDSAMVTKLKPTFPFIVDLATMP